MALWKKKFDLDSINKFSLNSLVSHSGILISDFGDDFLEATMPVDQRTMQPYGLLHGGASCVLAETLGSIAANLCLEKDFVAVGHHIEATHLRSATKGLVKGRAQNIFMGRNSQTWRIEIFNEDGKMICDSKIIMAVKPK